MLQHPHSQTDNATLLHTVGKTKTDSTAQHSYKRVDRQRQHSTAMLHTCGQTKTDSTAMLHTCVRWSINSVKCKSQDLWNLEVMGI